MFDRSGSTVARVLITGALTLVAGCYLSHERRSGTAGDGGAPDSGDSSVEAPLPFDLALVRGILRLSVVDGRADAQLTFQAWVTNDSSEMYEVELDRVVVGFDRGGRVVQGEAPVSPATLVVDPASETRNVFGALFAVPDGVIGACDSLGELSITAEAQLTVGDEERAVPVRLDGWDCSRF